MPPVEQVSQVAAAEQPEQVGGPRVEVLGVRHHGPGSARSVLRALDELGPELVVIEGPPELDDLVATAADPDLVPPVAALVYAVDQPRRAVFYPFAVFSPEWVALRWALEHGVEVRFADLPATHLLAGDHLDRGRDDGVDHDSGDHDAEDDDADDHDAGDHDADDHDAEPRRGRPGRAAGVALRRSDPIAALAEAAGYDDPERWWEDAVEQRRTGAETSALTHFAALREAMAGARDQLADDDDPRREAFMRRTLRAELKAGRSRIAVVCGAFHAPVLDPAAFPPVARDTALTVRQPRIKVRATWVPWSAARLGYASGYGAGVRSPGWYRHLFTTPDDAVVASWFVRVGRALREQQLDTSVASVVEATRLAGALAAVRGRPSVGLTELEDAARTVLTEGSDLPLRLIDRTLVVGEELGRVPDSTPTVPLAADLAATQRRLRLPVTAEPRTIEIDLRRESQLARSVLLHRLDLLGIGWGREVDAGRSTGTFKEAWELAWSPELAVAVIEASLYGTTVPDAAAARAAELARDASDLTALGVLIERCLLADLPDGLRAAVAVLAERTARQHDTLALLRTVEPLSRTCRYGDVRGVDLGEVSAVLETVVVRVAVGLRAACVGLDDDGAQTARTAVESADRGITLLDRPALTGPWRQALAAVAADDRVHGSVSGRATRLLLDAGLVDRDTAARRLARRLSTGTPAPAAAAWLDGFLTGEAMLLIHGDDLLATIDGWLAAAPEPVFEDLLPLVRRTFARFEPGERRLLGERLRRIGTGERVVEASLGLDLALAAPALATVTRLLGLPGPEDDR
ncbi:hypothetical protein FHX74_000614 [Friedmanniella endophytica]|uniref:Uncharacterized protein n=1 Tax=Microlunatus kandeliicorticis TaxID=1759536 RepID=A0A7W3P4P1_9ACTN|nr:DUF5682 family protein [Microlunatus kandeliicorticis]MBA8793020.1 hypothetical protein [Microlunatus kandeliicorticis]